MDDPQATRPSDPSSGTLPLRDGAGAGAFADPPTGSTWGRYRIDAPIGEGGMGRVFRAFDPLLSRSVALKLLFADTPARLERFLVEARSQARVDHPNICRVHEAGFVDGRPYIAMQLVAGGTLADAARDMPLEQKVRLFCDVAEGVHEAHRHGLVHRDLKPGNVLVERTADGPPRAVVVDFGLARDLAAAGPTATGHTVGTPAYMSPEQARADAGALDRRSDVYGIGATLFEALTGRPPFTGSSAVDVMVKLVTEEPPRPSALRPGLPRDLETIVLKCLEKDPARRYDSARALAEDLRRWLDGEPIAAAPPRPLERLARRARRHPATTATLAAALLLVLASAAFGAATLLASRRRAAAAQRFGQDAAQIESLLRASALAPAHDVRPERARVRERMGAIRSEMRRLGRIADAAGHEALGRGHLALGELDAARAELTAALAAGGDAPRAHQALGVTLSRLYEKRRAAVDALSDPQSRAERRQALDAELRRPALVHLGMGEKGGLAGALVAWLEQRYERAEQLAAPVAASEPWSVEAPLLVADARAGRVLRAVDAGDLKGAAALLAGADAAYEAAVRVGESEPRAYEGLCRIRARDVELAATSMGGDVEAHAARALAGCDAGLVVAPDDAALHELRAVILFHLGGAKARKGEDASAVLARSREEARRALAIEPSEMGWHELGTAWLIEAQGLVQKRADPRAALSNAVDALRKGAAIRQHPKTLNNLGLALLYRGDYEASHGLDPRASLAAAVAALRDARRLSPTLAMAWSNEGLAEATRAEWESRHGVDPRPAFGRSEEVVRGLLARSPDFVMALAGLGQTLAVHGAFETAQGREAAPLFDEAERHLARALRLNPQLALAHEVLGVVHLARAEAARRAGRAPWTELDRADEALSRGVAMDPTNVGAISARVDVIAARARALREAGRDPSAETARAEALLAAGEKLNAGFGPLVRGAAQALVEQARWDAARGRRTGALARAGALLSRATVLMPDDSDAWRLSGEADLLAAEAAARERNDAAPLLARAKESLEKARAINALDPEIPPLLEKARAPTPGQPASSAQRA